MNEKDTALSSHSKVETDPLEADRLDLEQKTQSDAVIACASAAEAKSDLDFDSVSDSGSVSGRARKTARKYVPYTVKLPSDQLSALQSIWLELKKLYGTHSPDKSGMIEAALDSWLKGWDGPDREALLAELLEIRKNTRRRQYKKDS
ncbi:MAG: hypothetical protein K8F91_18815 [Candidatus Obscuribacterales bacterium]|nr:hypothetical protein [Candidatus Obscuribacterales bacterium]